MGTSSNQDDLRQLLGIQPTQQTATSNQDDLRKLLGISTPTQTTSAQPKQPLRFTDQTWNAMTPGIQQSYQQNYNIEIVPVSKQQVISTQPEEQKPSMAQWATKALIEPIVKGEQAGARTSQKLRAGYLKTMGVIPSVTKLENKVFVEKDRAWLGDMASKGKLPPDSEIIAKLGEDRGNKLIAEINRLSPNLRKPEATRRARGEMGTQYATSPLGVIGEEVMNAIEQLTGPEQVLQPSQLAINLAGIGIGGKVATVAMDNAIKKGLTDAVKAKTMTPESAKQVFTAYKYYAQNTPAETIQAILRGDIPAPKVPGQALQTSAQQAGIGLARKPKPPEVIRQPRTDIGYTSDTGQIAPKQPVVAPKPVRGAIPSSTTEPITQVHGVERIEPFAQSTPNQKAKMTPAEVRAEEERIFEELFPDLVPKTGRNIDVATLTTDMSDMLGYGGEVNDSVLQAVSAVQQRAKELDYTFSETVETMMKDGSLLKFKKGAELSAKEIIPQEIAIEKPAQALPEQKAVEIPKAEEAIPEQATVIPQEQVVDEIKVNDKIRFIPNSKNEIPIEATVSEVITNQNGDKGFNVFYDHPVAGNTSVRLWTNNGKFEMIEKAPARQMVDQVAPKATDQPLPKNRMTADVFELVDDYKARSYDKFRAWDEFIKDRNLSPEMDAKEFYKIYDKALPKRFETAPKAEATPEQVVAKEPYEMSKKEAVEKEKILRQELKSQTQIAETQLQNAIGDKKIFVSGSDVQLAMNKNNLVKVGQRYVKKDSITPEIQIAIDDYNKAISEANNTYIREATPLNAHERTVEQAIDEGKITSHPDYPDLAKTAPKAETPIAETPKPMPEPTATGKPELVGYRWISTEGEKYSYHDGGLVGAKVSDWERSEISKGSGREIVHVYMIKEPDGTINSYGKITALKRLGVSDSQLNKKASKFIAEAMNKKSQVDAWKHDITDRKHFDTIAEANQAYRTNNSKNVEGFRGMEDMANIFKQSAVYEKDGKYVTILDPDITNDVIRQQAIEEAGYRKVRSNDISKSEVIPEVPKVSAEEANVSLQEEGFPTVQMNPNDIDVRPQEMQFKRIDDMATGTNRDETIAGEWDELKAGHVLVWQPKEGRPIVVNGHHRLKLAKENGVNSISVKILKEDDPSAPNGIGWSKKDAFAKGAEINIAEGKGSIYDRVEVLRNDRTTLSEDEKLAKRSGVSKSAGKPYTISYDATDNTLDAFTSRAISPDQTEIIAKSAPGDYDTQAIGIRLAKTGKTGTDLEDTIQALKMLESDAKLAGSQLDMFGGGDNPLFKRADDIAKIVKDIKQEINDKILSVKGILKRPKQAGEMGAQLKDAYATEQEVKKLEAERAKWDKWYEEDKDSEIWQRIDKELKDKNLADTAQFTMDLGAKAGEIESVEIPKTTKRQITQLSRVQERTTAPWRIDYVNEKGEPHAYNETSKAKAESWIKEKTDSGKYELSPEYKDLSIKPKTNVPKVEPVVNQLVTEVKGKKLDIPQPKELHDAIIPDKAKIAQQHIEGGDIAQGDHVFYPDDPESGIGQVVKYSPPEMTSPAEYRVQFNGEPVRRFEEGDLWKVADPKTWGGSNPPDDLIKVYMRDYKLSREEAIQKIKDSGVWETEGKPTKDTLVENDDPANDDVINQYAEGINSDPDKEKFGVGKVWQSFQTAYNYIVHRYQPIARITNFAQKGADVPEGENPLLLAKRYSGVEKIASEKIFKETRKRNPDGSSTVTGEGLAQVLEPVSRDIKDFSAYLAAERDIELMSREKPIKGSPKQAEVYRAINAIKNKYGANFKVFEDTASAFRDWTKRAMLDELKDIGILSQKNYDDILESNRFYAPFQRVMDQMERRGVIPSSKEAFTPHGKPIHKIVGSERQIIDPLENAITNCYKITDFIERQRVANATINLRNIDPRLQTVITEGRGRYEIPVYEDGVRKLYNVPKDLHTALKGMDEADMGTLMRIISFPTRTLRAGATLIPEFWFRNPIRDQFTAFVNAKYGFYPGYDFIKGMFHVLKKDELYHEAAASGAFQSMFTSLDRMTSRATLEDVLRGRQKYWSPKHPIEAVRSISQLFEEGTRTGVYGRAKSGGDILYKAFHRGEPKPSELGAMFEYREASTDFLRRGSQTKAVNQLIAFFNANIQGVDKMIRSFKDRPIESSIRAISSITIPTITLYMLNKDNPRYKELPQWEKDFFWIIIPSDDSPIIRIPKPFELGILFGTSAEHLIDYVEKRDPEAVKTLADSAWQALTPGVIPTGIQPGIESWANKNLFTNRKIVPSNLEKLPPEMQAEPYSSETAKAVGTWIKYSPLKIDNAIRGYFGGMGKYFTDSLDLIAKKYGVEKPPQPTKTLADIPLIRGFVAREPIGSVSESVNKFYKTYDDIQTSSNAIKQFQKEGKGKQAVEYLQKHPEAKFLSGFTKIAFSMAKARKTIQAIYDAPKMSPDKKRKAIDELNTLITKQAKLALEVYDNAKKVKETPKPTQEQPKSVGRRVGLEILQNKE
jgi:hypothetical protein